MNINIEIDDKLLSSVISSGWSGSSYWSRVLKIEKGDAPNHYFYDGGAAFIQEIENKKRHKITSSDIIYGLTLMAKNKPKIFAQIISGIGDVYTGDAVIQFAVFGELKYG